MTNIYSELNRVFNCGEEAALCTIVKTKGSAPRRIGAKMIVYADGRICGTIGGGALEKEVIKNAIETIKNKKPDLYRHDLVQQLNMCCGGTVDIYIEPVMKKNNLYIFGAGHVGQALARYALNTDFQVFMIDDRIEFLDVVTESEINKMNLHYSQALPILPFDERTFVCIMTYDHAMDRDILAYCLKKPHAYLGMIGSKRKVEITKKKFEQGMIAETDELEEVDMPMGIDILAEGPDEIAISILAQLIKVKNTKIYAK